MTRLARRPGVGSGEPLRIPPEKILHFGNDVQVGLDGPRALAYAWKRRLRNTHPAPPPKRRR